MALSIPTLLDTTTYSGAASAARTTGSISPTANALLLVTVVTWKSAAEAGAVTITDSSGDIGAWTTNETVVTGNLRVSMAWAQAGASPGTCTITATVTGSGTRWVIHTSEVTGHNTGTPITQDKSNSAASGTSLTVTLDSTPAATSMVYGVVGDHFATDTDILSGTGFTQLVETGPGTVIQAMVQYDLASADTTCDWSGLDGAGGSGIAAIAAEIAEASATGSILRQMMQQHG